MTGRWHSPTDAGQPFVDAATGAPIGTLSSAGIDFAAVVAYGPRRRRAGSPGADVPPAGHDPALIGEAAPGGREPGRAVSPLGQNGGDAHGLLDRHRGRCGGSAVLRKPCSPGTAERPHRPRRAGRESQPRRIVRGRPRAHAPHGRRGPDQRVQLPGLGDAREARAGLPRRRSDDRQARPGNGLRGRGGRSPHGRERTPARGIAATDLRRPRRSPRAPRRPRQRGVHRVGHDRGAPCAPIRQSRSDPPG